MPGEILSKKEKGKETAVYNSDDSRCLVTYKRVIAFGHGNEKFMQ
jgi:hypothetical protein